MKDIKYRYTCVKELSIFSKIFHITEIENGCALKWMDRNGTFVGVLHKDQFTSLLDKSGKEIYEGDIVICHPERKYGRRSIKIDLYNGFNQGDGGDFEIIGNIHENINLLTPQTITNG